MGAYMGVVGAWYKPGNPNLKGFPPFLKSSYIICHHIPTGTFKGFLTKISKNKKNNFKK